jgi:hypothetical protein
MKTMMKDQASKFRNQRRAIRRLFPFTMTVVESCDAKIEAMMSQPVDPETARKIEREIAIRDERIAHMIERIGVRRHWRTKKEKVSISPTGEFVCVCGNTPDSSGAFACDINGDAVEPTPDEWPNDLYRCDGCGRVFVGDTGEIKARVDLKKVRLISKAEEADSRIFLNR